jgi:hypothetical protein
MMRATTHEERRPAGWLASRTLFRTAIGLAAVTVIVCTTMIGVAASNWISRPFPGFFVLANRVIPSIGLPDWGGIRDGNVYQHTVVSVDGQPILTGADVYRHVERQEIGRTVTYELRSGIRTETLALASERFRFADYWAIFGSYLATGSLYSLLGLLGMWRFPATHLGRALLYVGSVGGIYGISGVSLYGPSFDAPIRHLHALAEAFLPSAFVYLTLALPRVRPGTVAPLLATACTLSAALAIPYALLLEQPGAYSVVHAACETYMGFAGLALTMSLVFHSTWSPGSHVLLHSATAGALLGLGVPAMVVLISGLSGGGLPVNIVTATAFLFPLCFGYGLVHDGLARRREASIVSMAAVPAREG